MNKQTAVFTLDPRKLDPKRGDLLPEIPLGLRVTLAGIVAKDLRDHPPPPNLRQPGAFVVDRHGLWDRLRGVVVEQRPEGPVDVEHAIPHIGGGPAFQLEELANVLLSALARRRELVERLAQFNVLAVYFSDVRAAMEDELTSIHEQASAAHDRAKEVDEMRQAIA